MPYGSLTGDLYSMSSGNRAGYAESNNPASFLRSLIPSQKKNEEDENKPDSGKPSSGLAGTITPQSKDSMNAQKDSGLHQKAKAPQSDIETAIANVSNQYAIWFGDRYAFTPKEAETFRTLVSGSADPVDTAGRYIASTAIAKRIDGNAADIYANLDSLSEYFTGDVYRPDDSTFMEKVNASFGSIELLDMMGEWMNLVNKKGFDDPDAVALEQKIIAKDAEIGGIMNGIPSGFWSSVLNDAVASLGYTLEGIKYGAGASVGFMAAAAPGVGAVTAANPIAGAAVGATAGIWAGFSGTVAGFQRTGDLSMYQTFWDLTHLTDAEGNLLPRDKAAANLYAGINKNITGFLETMGEGVISRGIGAFSPVLTKKLGIPNLSMKILTDRGVSGSMSRFVHGGIDWVTGGLNEGFIQEGPEEVTTQVLTALYKNGVGGESDLSLKKLASDYLTSSIRGSLVGLVYGGVGIPQAMRNYNQLSMDLRRTANTTDSEEVFFEKTENAKPEDISKEDYDAARRQIYEAGKEQRDAYFEARRGTVTEYADLATEELYDTVNPETGAEEGVIPDGTVYRNPEDNSLFTETKEENGRKRVYAGDRRTGAVYGYAEVSTDGDTLTVGSVRVRQGYEGIREELVRKAISEQRTGESSIEWNPDSEGLRRVKDMLVQNNPRGRDAGLDYGADFSPAQDHDIQSLAGNIREAMPALSREESVVAARLYSAADSDGALSKLNNGQPVQKNTSLSSRYRGAADGAKAIIYAGKNADFSTFYHELFHVNATQRPAESKQLSNAIRTSMQDEASKANLRKFLEESGSIWGDGFSADSVMKNLESIPADSDASQWSRAQFEDLARLAEAYAAADNSKRSSLPEAIRNILKKIADFMRQVYQTVKHTVPLPKEITDAYDAIIYKTRASESTEAGNRIQYQNSNIIRQPLKENTYESAIELVTEAHPQFVEIVEDIRQLTDAESEDVSVRKTFKGKKRSTEKAADDYRGDFSQILDYDGAMIQFDSILDAENAWEAVKKKYKDRIVKEKHLVTKMGYQDFKINLRMDNGAIAEIQFLDKNTLAVKSGIGHKLYEIYRTLDILNSEHPELTELQAAIAEWSREEYSAKDVDDYSNSEARRNAVSSVMRQALSSALSRYHILSDLLKGRSITDFLSSEGISLETGEAVAESILNGISLISTNSNSTSSSIQSINEHENGVNGLLYQKAYHGSPHRFDIFSTDHIGEGAGSQSFGWGIYITGDMKIAEGYAELGVNEEEWKSDLEYFQKTLDAAKRKLKEAQQKLAADPQNQKLQQEYNTALRYLRDEEGDMQTLLSSPAEGRNLYTVDIPDTGYIKWDNEVPESLAMKIAKALKADEYDTADIMQYYRTSGAEMYSYLSKQLDGDKNASLFLRNLGIMGIDYPAGTKWGLPDGAKDRTRNYVIFNADDIQITDHLMYQDAKAPDTSDLSEDEKMKRQQAESIESRETLPGSSEDLDDFYDEYDSGMDSIETPEDAEKIARIYSEWDIEVDEDASNTDASLIDEEEIPDWFGDTVNLKPDGTMAENEAEYEKAVNEELIPELERDAGVVHESRETQSDTEDEAEGQNYPGIRYFDAFDEELTWKQFVDRNKPEADYSQAETDAEKDDIFARTIQDDDSLIRYLGIIGEALYLNTSRLNNDWHFIDQIQRERIKARVFDTITDTSIRNASLMAIRPGTEKSFSKRMLNSVRKEMTENSRFYRNILSYMLQDNAMKPEELIKEVKGLAIPSRDVLDAMPVSELRALAMQARDEEIVDQIENGTLRIHGGEDDKRLAEINAAIGSIGERIRAQQAELRENEASISSLQGNLESVSAALDERDKAINDLLSDLQRTEAIARADAKKLSDEEIEASSFTEPMRKIAAELRELNEKTYDRFEAEHLKGKKGKYEVPQARRDARAEYINHIAAFYPEVFEKDGKKFGKLDDHIRDTLSPSGFREVREVINARREELRTEWKNEAAEYVKSLSRSVVNVSERISSDIDAALDRMAALQKEIDRQKKLKDRIKDNRRRQIFDARTEERWKAAKKALETEKKHNQEIQNIKSFNAWKNRQTKIETDEKLQSVIRKAKDDASLLADWMKAKADFRISELKKEQREKRKQERLYRRIRTEKEKLGRAISRPVNLNTTDYSVAEPIMAIQAIVDPVFRTEWTWNLETNPEGTAGGGTMTITDAIAYLSNLQEDDRNNILSVLSPDLVARLTGTRNPLNDWSLSQLRQLAEEVSELRRRGREILSAKKAFERETIERIQQSIIDAVRRVKVKDDDRDTLPGSVERIKAGQNARARFRSARYITMRMQELAQLLDGGLGHRGAAYGLLVDEKRYHQSREWRAIDSRIQKVANLLTDEAVKNLFEKVTLDLPGGYNVTFNIDDLAYAYLSQFDEDSRAAVAYGNLLDEKEKGTIKNTGHLNDDGEFVPDMMSPGSIADPDELQSLGDARYDIVLAAAEKELNERGLMPLVEAIRDDFESDENFSRLNLASIESYNTPLKRVQHYLPIFRTDLKGESFRNDMADQLFNLNTGDFTAAIDKGMTIQRIKISPRNQRSVNLSLLGTWNKAVRNQEHLIEYAQYAKKLRSVFGTNAAELIAAVNQKYSPALMKEVNEYINAVIDPYSGGKKELWENTVKNLRGRLGSAYLGWKLPGVVLQFCTSAWPFLPDVGVRSLLGGYLQLAAENKRAFDFIYDKSPMMKHRTMNTILQEAVERRQNSYDRGKAGRAIDKFNEIGMLGLEWVDKTLVAGGWLGAYNKALKQNLDAGMDTALADAAAAKTADDVVLRTQPAGDSTELPSLFRTRNELAKAFLQFQSSLSVIFNNLTGDLVGFWRNKQYGKIISTVVSYGMAGLMLGLVAEGFDDDDDGADKARKLGYWFLTQGIESFPVFGSDISLILQRALTGEKDYYGNGVDMFPGITRIASGIEDIALSDKPFMEGVWKVAEGAGLFAGAPVSGFKNLKRVAEEGPLALLGR